jgi:hypothetical protein
MADPSALTMALGQNALRRVAHFDQAVFDHSNTPTGSSPEPVFTERSRR